MRGDQIQSKIARTKRNDAMSFVGGIVPTLDWGALVKSSWSSRKMLGKLWYTES
jgi:hypothetical protein